MTRGTLVLLNSDKMYVAQEINGDMYLHFKGEVYDRNSRGAKAYERLKEVKTKKDLKELLNELYFNDLSEDEKGKLVQEIEDQSTINEMLSFNNCNERVEYKRDDGSVCEVSWYFYNWFSDYVFIKNNTGKAIKIIDKTHQVKEIEDQEVIVLSFGEFYQL